MFILKIGRKKINVPSAWDDLSARQFIEITETNDEKKIIEIISGIPFEQSFYILEYLDFLKRPIELDSIEESQYLFFKNEAFKCPEIKSCSWGQKICLSNLLKQIGKSRTVQNSVCEILAIYFQPIFNKSKFNPEELESLIAEFEKESFFKIYSVAKNFIRQFNELIEYELKLLSEKPSPEQIKAGVNMFNQLGDFNSIDALASGDVLKYEALLEVDYSTILNKLYKNKLERIFNARLREQMK